LRFTSIYNPESDLAERANRQVLEALRAAVATVVQYDEWDEALPHVTLGLNTHVNTVTKVSPFEVAHRFQARVPLTMGLVERQEFDDDTQTVSLISAFRIDTRQPPITWQLHRCTWVICSRNVWLHHESCQGTKYGWTLNTRP